LKAFDGKKCVVLLDTRLSLVEIPADLDIVQFPPTLYGRFSAELFLWKNTSLGDIVLCFGNLPPLIKNRGLEFVYVQINVTWPEVISLISKNDDVICLTKYTCEVVLNAPIGFAFWGSR